MAFCGTHRFRGFSPWGRIETALETRVYVRIAGVVLANRIVRDVLLLRLEIIFIANAVLVVSGVLDLTGKLFADCERVAALDELNTARRAHIDCGSDENVEMVGHDREGMKRESALVAVAEEGCDHQLGIRGALENSVALRGEDGNRIGAQLLANGGHEARAYPRG